MGVNLGLDVRNKEWGGFGPMSALKTTLIITVSQWEAVQSGM